MAPTDRTNTDRSATAIAAGRTHNNGLRLALAALTAATLWAYWPTIVGLFKEWRRNDDYSAGQLVPLVAVYLLWRIRHKLASLPLRPCILAIALLLTAQLARFYGLLFLFESAERYSLVLTIAALALMVAGVAYFAKVFWIWAFLLLMVPLPGRIHNMISGPLQNIATSGSVFMLEAFGTRVSRHGNVVMLNEDTPMAVAEACSGLRMLMAFVIVAAFMAIVVNRSRKKKIALLLAAIPVAVACNIVRLTVTGGLFIYTTSAVAERFFHDFAGLAMMPVAVMLMFAQLWLMEKLTIHDSSARTENRRPAVAEGDTTTV